MKILNPNCKVYLFIFAMFLSIPKTACGQYYNGAVSSALGGAGRATASPSEISYLNPAGIVHTKDFYISFHYTDSKNQNSQLTNNLGVILLDGAEDAAFPAALSFMKKRYSDNRGVVNENDYQLSIADFVARGFSFGLTYHYLSQEVEQISKTADQNFSVGLMWAHNKDMAFALTGHDLARIENVRMNPKVGAGVHYIYKKLMRIRGDLAYRLELNPNKAFEYMAGYEVNVFEEIFIRLGAKWDNWASTHYLTTGFGWDGPRLGMNYAYQTERLGSNEQRHVVDLRIFF